VKRVIGHILRENRRMIELSRRLGFVAEAGRAGNADITVVKQLGAS
jgi:acetyltransferase